MPPQTTWQWLFRGDNLCAWEAGLRRPLRYGEIVIDPDIGRVLIGLDNAVQRDLLLEPQDDGSRRVTARAFTARGASALHSWLRGCAPAGNYGIDLGEST